MKKTTRVLRTTLALTLTASALTMTSACGSGTAETTAAAATETTTAAETTAPAKGQASEVMAESVTLAQTQDIASMNPWVAGNTSYEVIIPEIYEPLGAYDTFGGEFHGVLMSDWKKVDEKTYDVTLYDYIYDQAGNHMTAADVVFSCNKCWEKGELAETAIVESVEALDDYTVEFVFKSTIGMGDFESVVTNIRIVTEAAYTASEDEMITTPVGTGPYKLAEYVTGSSVTIEATGEYWQTEDKCLVPTQLANVKAIRCDVISESSQLATALQTGAIAASDSIEGESATLFQNESDYGTYVFVDPNGRSLMANMSEDSKMSDENLRKAVFYAIDQETVMAFVNGGNNSPLAVFGSSCYADYDESWNETNYPYDVEKAKEYLAQSAYPDGCTLVMNLIAGKEADEECALVLQEELAEIGITLELNTYQIAQYLPLEHDSAAWDLAASGFPTYTGYMVNAWQKYFDMNTTGGACKNFLQDEELQSLFDACLNPDTYGAESYNAFVQYLQDHAICKGLYAPDKTVIYNKSVVETIVLNQAQYMVPGAFTYAQ